MLCLFSSVCGFLGSVAYFLNEKLTICLTVITVKPEDTPKCDVRKKYDVRKNICL